MDKMCEQCDYSVWETRPLLREEQMILANIICSSSLKVNFHWARHASNYPNWPMKISYFI